MNTVSIDIDSKWAKRSRSPGYRLALSLRGVAMTSAPILLYGAGRGWFRKYDYLVAALCFAMIYLVGWFYVLLGNEVIWELKRKTDPNGANLAPLSEEEKARLRRLGLWAAVCGLAFVVWAISR